jgi:hypothetical protein
MPLDPLYVQSRGPRRCIVCALDCSEHVLPFGILTDAVPAHLVHGDREIQSAWMTWNEQARAHLVDRPDGEEPTEEPSTEE